MKMFPRGLVLLFVLSFSAVAALAVPVKIGSGQLFIGGGSYGTGGYQNYLRFEINGSSRNPQRNFRMTAEQIDAVYLNHPTQPAGEFDYKVGMPNHASGLLLNDTPMYPVWYADSVWIIRCSLLTPDRPAGMPPFVTVTAPFKMNGSTDMFGAFVTGFRISGSGTAEIKFENIAGKYYVREARYLFGTSAPVAPGDSALSR